MARPQTVRIAAVLLLVLCCLINSVVAAAQQDYYEILGLPQKDESSEKDIKKQFRALSKQWHPDQNPTDEAREMYKKIQRAAEVLSDRRKRKIYDMKGEEGLKQLEEAERNPNGGQMDPFAAFFGGGQRNNHKGQDVQMNLQVSLRDIYNGGTHKLRLQKQKLCRTCRGSGAASKSDLTKCTHCQGKGTILQRVQIMPGFVQQMQQPCSHCGGKGKMVKKKCKACGGNKVVRGDYELEVDIEKGIPDNHRLVFDMEADQSPDLIPGDVIFIVQTQADPVFTRKNNDLEATMTITLKEALLGFSRELEHMDGRRIAVSASGVSQYGRRLKIAGEGMPIHNVPSERGDLFVTLQYEMPRSLTEQQAKVIQEQFGTEAPQ